MRIGAVIAARDEAATLPRLLAGLAWAGVAPVTVVANGCRDGTAALARDGGARVLEFPEPVGHDVGRALGAAATPDADGLLFVDGDLPLKSGDLAPFVAALERGVDVALNHLDPFLTGGHLQHPVFTGKRFLNIALGRRDLGHSTLTAVPHALSRRALRRLGARTLAIPAVAHVRSILAADLRVEAVHGVDVVQGNRRRPAGAAGRPEETVERLILGDQLEALGELLLARGNRGGCTDLHRRRELLPPEGPPSPGHGGT